MNKTVKRPKRPTVFGVERDEVLSIRRRITTTVSAAQHALWGKLTSGRLTRFMRLETCFGGGNWQHWRAAEIKPERSTKRLLAELALVLSDEAGRLRAKLSSLDAARADIEGLRRELDKDWRPFDVERFPVSLPKTGKRLNSD